MKLLSRAEVPVSETWDLTLIYASEELLYEDLEKIQTLSEEIHQTFKGKLTDAAAINACIDKLQRLAELESLTGNYGELAVSVDYYNSHNVQLNDRINMAITKAESLVSFVDTEITSQSDEILNEAISMSKTNAGYLRNLRRMKPHLLSPETERTLAALSQTFDTPYNVYNMSKLADMKFDSFEVNGKTYPLGYALFEDDYSYEPDTAVRRTAFEKFSEKIAEYQNVTAAAYNAQVTREKTMATLRGFDSVIDSLLFPQHVTREMYDRQIDLIMEHLAPHMRRYAKLIQKIYGLEEMTYADLMLSIDPEYTPKITIEESKKYIEDGLSCMGEEYVEMIRRAYRERWVDFAKNQGKSTGGFCSSPYGKGSFILMSWNDRMSDVITLAHELGHAGHFGTCNDTQSIFDTDVSMYFLEAPSTINELIMAHYMLKTNDDPRFRRWVLSCIVGNTYYHNFVTHLLEAAYQREVYRIIDDGGSVQADTLNKLMHDTLKKFWGDDILLTEGAELTWMRQPHYYMGLYPYTYSAGLTVATEVCNRIQTEGAPAVEDWKKVLAAGSTMNPVELAALAKVDITTDAPLLHTIESIGAMIDEICEITEKLQ